MLRPTKLRTRLTTVVEVAFVLAFPVFVVWVNSKKTKIPDKKVEIVLISDGDTTRVDVSGWDSTKFDSLARAGSKLTKADDSLNAVYSAKYAPELRKLDSMMNAPVSPMVDSLLKEFNDKGEPVQQKRTNQ